MQQIFDSSALSIFPLSDGMIFAYCQDRDGDLMTVAFKSISFDDGKMINVTSDFFSIAKFGAQYKSLLFQVENPVTCKVAYLPNGNTFIADQDGNAKIINRDLSIVWSGELTHKGCPVSGVAVDGSSLWCSFKDSSILVRYNTRTMRDELRLGGGKNTVIGAPKGIYISDGIMRVCDCEAGKIHEINLSSYSMSVYREFDEPVHQYIKVRSHELVLLDSGIYLL
ncbi:MAG: hypothetical protein IKL44_00855 [Clostridia bacterium]|nr:hypothetical protein [Clostridia bacterium]MBR3593200.1 hypothetical protein [Clostridia bacterium]